MRLLREAGGNLWPLSGRGGGKSARHVEAGHLANLILAFGGPQPSDAPATVAKLGVARWSQEKRTERAASNYPLSALALLKHQQDIRPRDLDLHGMLVLLLGAVGGARVIADTGRRTNWTLWLNPELGTASVTWINDGKEYRERYESPQPGLFTIGQRPPSAVERLVRVPFALIEAVAELATDIPASPSSQRSLASTSETPSHRPRRRGETSPPVSPSRSRGPQRTKGRTTSLKK